MAPLKTCRRVIRKSKMLRFSAIPSKNLRERMLRKQFRGSIHTKWKFGYGEDYI